MSEPLQEILVPGEVIERQYELEGDTSLPCLTVTNVRCILWRPPMDMISEFDKKHLSSIDYVLWDWWIFGVILIGVGIVSGITLASVLEKFKWVGGAVGVPCVAVGIALLFRQEQVMFWVTGRKDAIKVTRTMYLWRNQEKRLRSLLAMARSILENKGT